MQRRQRSRPKANAAINLVIGVQRVACTGIQGAADLKSRVLNGSTAHVSLGSINIAGVVKSACLPPASKPDLEWARQSEPYTSLRAKVLFMGRQLAEYPLIRSAYGKRKLKCIPFPGLRGESIVLTFNPPGLSCNRSASVRAPILCGKISPVECLRVSRSSGRCQIAGAQLAIAGWRNLRMIRTEINAQAMFQIHGGESTKIEIGSGALER